MEQGNTDVTGGCQLVKATLTRIGDKWTILVIRMLGERPMRFNELRRKIDGVSQRMLSLTLRGLERDGFVIRSVRPTVPPQVDYTLTELGTSLLVPVRALGDWAFAHEAQVEAARARYDRLQGQAAVPALTAKTGDPDELAPHFG
ncbi:helix-turn-helix domain-containing protein [Roseiarcaceae bacterium H3SJ34-1]|uniref:winged helix-turn-helix transcriptional regulator n=1 Tax=Terripilifer ovatus TaxID=3032367 RepID=UPI003AB94ADE|nr:helix-turn-helix domain-containing protein [Roseiarcaceae bacterium H3SJ34-1]